MLLQHISPLVLEVRGVGRGYSNVGQRLDSELMLKQARFIKRETIRVHI